MEIRRPRNKLTATLALTSLIDAFSILVLYLLLVTQNGITDIDLKNSVTLPQAESAPFVSKEPLVVRLEKNRFFIKNESFTEKNLIRYVKTQKNMNVAVQAGNKEAFGNVEALIQTLRRSGVEKVELLAERSQ